MQPIDVNRALVAERHRRYRAEAAAWHLAARCPFPARVGMALRRALRRAGPARADAPPRIARRPVLDLRECPSPSRS
ncbi:MAG: hypothetical protein ACXVJ7_03965 [Acidimicrobiia bacterium]